MNPPEAIQYAQVADDLVVVRVRGRANHVNSSALREIMNLTSSSAHSARYIIDFEQCESMDSTFMGVLASMAQRQERLTGTRLTATNLSAHVRGLLEILGLNYVMDIRTAESSGSEPELEEARNFCAVIPPSLDKLERTLMMIEAHEKLIDIDSANEIKFRGVLQTLRESLDRSREGVPGSA